jgi:FkbM family methyltransferase
VNILEKSAGAAARAVWAVKSGDRLRDKLAILLMLARVTLFPLARIRDWGAWLPDPGNLIAEYTCISEGLTIRCPGGGAPYFLFADPRHDPGVRAAVSGLVSGTFIDVGAHVGFFSLPAGRRLAGLGRVIAIEPHPVRRRFLEQNVLSNGLTNVTCCPFAIGDRDGLASLYDLAPGLGPHACDVSLAASPGQVIEVQMRSLDSLCVEMRLESVVLVKIDVEGFEHVVIAGMRLLIDTWRPDVVFEALTPQSLSLSTALLVSHGYEVHKVDTTNYLGHSPDGAVVKTR